MGVVWGGGGRGGLKAERSESVRAGVLGNARVWAKAQPPLAPPRRVHTVLRTCAAGILISSLHFIPW